MSLVPRKLLTSLIVLLQLPLTIAFAQGNEAETAGVRVFEPIYFAEFDPLSALELVFRTPGFNPQESDGGRGLSGVRSNILIDGERPPPKGQSIRQQLGEMPVSGVAYLELIDIGARQDIDMQGYSQVVNVVTVANAPAYYEFISEFRRSGTGDVRQENERNIGLEAIGSFSWNAHEFTMRGDYRERDNQSPADIVAIDPANPVQRITSVNQSDRQNVGLELGANLRLPNDSALMITSQLSTFENESSPYLLDDTGDSLNQTSSYANDQRDISAEYRRPILDRATLMFAIVDAHREQQNESSLTSGSLNRASISDRESGETAARILIEQPLTSRLTVRTTATTAYNYFEGGFRLFDDGVELPVEGSDSRVEEDRRSIEGSVDWSINERWTLLGSLGLESYEIESRDESSGLRTDPLGQLSVSFRPRPRTTWVFESTRRIGQLSFSQFLASSSLSSEILTAGASTLEPERRWTHSVSYDQRFGDKGVLRFSLVRQEIDNPVNSVPLTDELIVSQNTDPETIDRIQASLDFPFSRFGLDELILEVQGMLAQSDATDPVTGEAREVSGLQTRYWSLGLRRDPGAGNLAWGMSMGRRTSGDDYAVRGIFSASSSPEWRAFFEWEMIEGLKLRMNVDGPREATRISTFYGSIREPGLDPSFFSTTRTWVDRSASVTLQWRRRDRFELTANLATRPKIRTEETLTEFGAVSGSLLATEFITTPRAMLRFRMYR